MCNNIVKYIVIYDAMIVTKQSNWVGIFGSELVHLSGFAVTHFAKATKVFPKDTMWLSILRIASLFRFHVCRVRKVFRIKIFKGVSKHVKMRNGNMLLNLRDKKFINFISNLKLNFYILIKEQQHLTFHNNFKRIQHSD